MKRYWLFCFDKYYPIGGLNDLQLTSDNIEDCIDYLTKTSYSDYHCYDSITNKVIELNTSYCSFDNVDLDKQVETK